MSKSKEVLTEILLINLTELVLELVPDEAMPGDPIFSCTLEVVKTLQELAALEEEEDE